MQKNILIVTHSNDHEGVSKVMQHIELLGHTAIRLNTDRFPSENSLALYQDSQGWDYCLTTADASVHGTEIDAVWYRRFAPAAGLQSLVEKPYLSAAQGESREVLLNFLSNLDCFKVDDYWTVRRAAQKELQLAAARKLGMTIPSTLISNDPVKVQAFCREHSAVVAKMLHSFAVYQDNKEQVVFTSEVTEAQINDSLKLCPMIFQQKVAKQKELRVTVVGDECFCIAISSALYAGADVDWRRKGYELIDRWQPEQLPPTIEAQCIALCRTLNLNYGAIDLIVDPDGRYIFLEVNPSGEFYWAEQFNQLAITESIARLLIGQSVKSAAKAA